MTDIVTPKKRSEMMSGIKGKNTKPEITVRKELFRRGFRYRLHGKPDLVFAKYNAVLFVNGCFWDGHNCSLFKWPKSNAAFWKEKITGNINRDKRNREQLKNEGWRVTTIWECALKGKSLDDITVEVDKLSNWLLNDANK